MQKHPARFTHIVVGAGTAGCLLAHRLAAHDPQNRRVLLLEAGGSDRWHPWLHIPAGYLYTIGNPRCDWMWRTEPEGRLHGRAIRYPRGRTLGGCSSINGMLYVRGHAADYDRWAAVTGEPAWAWKEMLPLFKRHERFFAFERDTAGAASDRAAHGADGELYVQQQRLRWDVLDAFAESATAAGVPAVSDFNNADGALRGVSYFHVNQRDGWRWSAASAFLFGDRAMAARSANPACLAIRTHAQVARLVFADGGGDLPRTTGVELTTGERIQIEDGGDGSGVVLCAGAIATPMILMRSGIGAESKLKPHGIPVRVPLTGVGENLQDHLQLRTCFRLKQNLLELVAHTPGNLTRTLNTRAATLFGRAAMAADYALRRRGPLSMAPSQLGIFEWSGSHARELNYEIPSAASASRPFWSDVEFHVQPLSLDAFGEPLHDFDAVTASVCHLRPDSRGSVTLRNGSGSATDAPIIQPNYLSEESDRRAAAFCIAFARHIAAQQPFASIVDAEHAPGLSATGGVQTVEELAAAAGRIGTTIFHPVGTCAMTEVVTPRGLRVRGVDGLRVVDASVMPFITSGNTNAPTLAIAERAAEWINSGE